MEGRGSGVMFSDPEVTQEFTDALRGCSCVKELNLDGCGLSSQAQIDLILALEVNSALESLSMDRNHMSEDVCNQFYQSLPKMRGLQTLPFEPRFFKRTERGNAGDEFLAALGKNSSLLRTNKWYHNFENTFGRITRAKMELFFSRNIKLRKVESSFELGFLLPGNCPVKEFLIIPDRQVKVLPFACEKLASNTMMGQDDGSGVAAIYKLASSAGHHFGLL